MLVDIVTIFPEMFSSPFSAGTVRRAVEAGALSLTVHNLRDFTHDRHRTVDDSPFGGGAGMVFKPEPLFEAVESLRREDSWVVLLSPQGELLRQPLVQQLAVRPHLILLCGRYEGVDERAREHLVDQEISIGDYLLSGGELAAIVVVEAVARLLPGVLGSPDSLKEESLTWGLLEYPHYTRPASFRGWAVPPVLLSGNHALIARWRREQALRRTRQRRPDLLAAAPLSPEDQRFLSRLEVELAASAKPESQPGKGE